VVARGSQAVLFTRPATQSPAGRRLGVAVYGCVAGSGNPVALGSTGSLQQAALNGTTAAYAWSQVEGIDTSSTSVSVADLRQGRRLFEVPAGRIAIAPSFVRVDALVVSPDGTVAWIQHGGTVESPGYSVQAASPARPSDHQLAAGSAIRPGSLRISEGRVSWVEAGQRRFARI
jgi:hypothetical protein